MMKAKLKNPDVAKQKGMGHVKACLKKLFKTDITEPIQFFYDSEFDYGEIDPKTKQPMKEPIMYIGEVTGVWKKWIKQIKGKTSKTFVAGNCLFDTKTGILKLEAKMGKGAKSPVLKVITKSLLKPFAKAVFVESLESGEVIATDEDTEEGGTAADTPPAGTEFNVNVDSFLTEVKTILEEGKKLLPELQKIIKDVYLKFIKGNDLKTVDDKLIELIKGALDSLKKSNNDQFLQNAKLIVNKHTSDSELKGLISSGEDKDGKVKEYSGVFGQLQKMVADLDKMAPQIQELKTKGVKVEKVENPAETEHPPVSTDPFQHLLTQLNLQAKQQSGIKDAADLMKKM